MAKANLSLISNRSGDTERLKSLADGGGSVRGPAAALLDRDSGAYGISPAGIFKADGLDLLYLVIYVQSGILGDLLRLFDVRDAIAV